MYIVKHVDIKAIGGRGHSVEWKAGKWLSGIKRGGGYEEDPGYMLSYGKNNEGADGLSLSSCGIKGKRKGGNGSDVKDEWISAGVDTF